MTDQSALDRATAVLTINLGAIAANWRRLRDMVGTGCEAAAVVKADAYGLGAAHVAPVLWAAGCRTFFVATVDEGLDLRAHLPKAAIHVLCGPLPGALDDLAQSRLIPVLNSLDQIGLWAGFARSSGQSLPAAIHLDTAMTRLGLDQRDVVALAQNPGWLSGLKIHLIMSHLACADDPAHPANQAQQSLFTQLSQQSGLSVRRALSASSGIFLGAPFHFDLVRPGAALYGINPLPGTPNPMDPVVSLHAKVLQVRDVDSPQCVGYGSTYSVPGPGRIACIGVGYADGLFRSLGNRGHACIDGRSVPVVGRISMDLTTLDISHLPPYSVHPGSLVELIGPHHPLDDLAGEAGTIGYEILTALGRRYVRHYQTGESAS